MIKKENERKMITVTPLQVALVSRIMDTREIKTYTDVFGYLLDKYVYKEMPAKEYYEILKKINKL